VRQAVQHEVRHRNEQRKSEMRLQQVTILTLLLASAATVNAAPASPPTGVATEATRAANAKVASSLPLANQDDFKDATRGRLGQIEGGIIRNAKGDVVWDANSYAFLAGAAPATVNPSLWRQSQLNAEHGLFEVVPGIYQLRGYDISVMTLIKGKTGWIIVDPLTAVETAAAGLALANRLLGERPVAAVIFTHSHADHFGGVRGVTTPEAVASGKVMVVAPHGFLAEAVSENVLAGNYMGRRATFQFGGGLPRDATGQVGTGLGQALPTNSTASLIKPTVELPANAAPLVIDGITFQFADAAQTEAPAEFVFYLPEFNALCSSEVATGTFHNVLTPRGAKVRDSLAWSKVIDGMLRQYGDKAEVVFGSHNWPSWGKDNVRTFLSNQRDMYRYIHDQTVRGANRGGTMTEIAEEIVEPETAKSDFSVRGYYGTINHNSKAVFQHYFGWWDGVPANYNPHPPVEEARRYVTAMGGEKKALAIGTKAFAAGDYRWSSKVFNHIVFANPDSKPARDWLAASYEQQGFQAESGAWRNYFLKGAQELREGALKRAVAINQTSPAYLAGVPTSALFDALAARFNPSASTREAILQFRFTDRNEVITLHAGKATLFPRMGEEVSSPAATITTTRAAFDLVLAGSTTFPASIASGAIKITGDASALAAVFGSLDQFPANFNVVTP
jgi:alkyl sulfatase BDS1-like metallo-beta-lactamase superfamily hydrolase